MIILTLKTKKQDFDIIKSGSAHAPIIKDANFQGYVDG
jgi:hypothetical protein